MSAYRRRLSVVTILLGYLALAGGFAWATPPWQSPDEPAHYNYVAQLIDGTGGLPVLEEGDYPFARLEQLKAAGFPDDQSVDGIAYEDYQPPGYYVLAAIPMALSGQSRIDRLRAGRLFGVFIGAVTVCLAWVVARRAVPGDALVAVGATAFVAFLPMHLAMNAAVNNDPLAYAIMGAVIYLSLARVTGRLAAGPFHVLCALAFGAALLTKVSTYPSALLLIAAAWAEREGGLGDVLREGARTCAACLVGLVAALPWLVRNAVVYGWTDPLGIARHNDLVRAQPRTADWIADNGFAAWLSRLVTFTFESFWGVFGWMAVFLDRRIYLVLAFVTAIVALGFAHYVYRAVLECRHGSGKPCAALGLLSLALGMSVAVFSVYNLTFVQHQGRYLFTALIPVGVFWSLGLREIVRVVTARLGRPLWSRPLERAAVAAFAVALAGLAWISLTRWVIPGLS